MSDLQICVTAYSHDRAVVPDAVNESTWEDFVEYLADTGHVRTNDKTSEEVGLFSLNKLKPGKTRAKESILEVSGWVLDLDKASEAEIAATRARLDAAGLTYVVYSTHGHTPHKPKLRILGPLAAPVPAKEWLSVWRAIVDTFTGKTSDEACKDSSRLYYFPSCKPGATPVFEIAQGSLALDVATLKIAPKSPRAADLPVDLNAPGLLDQGLRVARCPIGVTAFEHAEHLARTMPAAVAGAGGSNAALRFARALVWGLELNSLQAGGLFREFYNPRCDPEWTEQEIDHKIESASSDDGAPYARGALLVQALEGAPAKLPDSTLDQIAQQHGTDTGNAQRLVVLFGDRVRFCTPRKKWLMWTGQRWEWDARDQIQELGKAVARAMWDEVKRQREDSDAKKAAVKNAMYAESRQGLTNMIELAKSSLAVLPNDLDADPWVFNVQNGTLDLRTGVLRAHSREDLITKLSPVEYAPDARSSLWDECLAKFTGGDADLSAYLQRALGYALYGFAREKSFWFAYGKPDGGKSTFMGAVAACLGDYHVAADSETWLTRHDAGGNRGDLVRLLGARLVTSSEFKPGGRFDVKIMKSITGGDPLTAAAKYEGEVTFQPSFALWLGANDAPTIHDDDDGMWRRVRRVPFTHPIPRADQDPAMQEKLQAPAVQAAILAWLVRGCAIWQRDGLGSCAAVDESNAAYRAEMDRVEPFFDECCVFDPTTSTSAKVLREAYSSYCQTARIRVPVGAKEFARKLRLKQCEDKKSNGTIFWAGVRLT